MYTKEEASRIRQHFWTSFGQYMKPVPSASGEKTNWSNYKTGIANIYFRLRAEKGHAAVSIELTDPSAAVRERQYEQLMQLQSILHDTGGESWTWEKEARGEHGNPISRIHQSIGNVNVMNSADWPTIIAFLKKHIITLDSFWNDVQHVFQ